MINIKTDPRKVGGRYLSGYWQQLYTVTAVTDTPNGRVITCDWYDGRTTAHQTPWDALRDSIVCQP